MHKFSTTLTKHHVHWWWCQTFKWNTFFQIEKYYDFYQTLKRVDLNTCFHFWQKSKFSNIHLPVCKPFPRAYKLNSIDRMWLHNHHKTYFSTILFLKFHENIFLFQTIYTFWNSSHYNKNMKTCLLKHEKYFKLPWKFTHYEFA